jgi:hypothetical protein
MQLKLLPTLGVFPWECVMCRNKSFHRDNGHRGVPPDAVLSPRT